MTQVRENVKWSMGVILFLLCLFCTPSAGHAQRRTDGKITMQIHRQPLNAALKSFGRVAGVKVNFSTEDVKPYWVTADIRNETVSDALARILAGKPFRADWQGRIVTVVRVKEQPLPQKESKAPKTKTVKGRVLDEDKISLPGANVRTPDGKQGTITSARGDFTLELPVEAEELEISFVGLKSEKINLKGRTYVDVVLHEDKQVLDEVVVTGYQTIEKGRATGSFSLLNKDDMETIYSTDIRQKLEGAAPGLLVNSNNELEIRGVSSLYANTAPLIVVDGFPMESSTLNLNPNDIGQISVLKDAASASIWGIRAANGVVVITTRRGVQKKRLEVNYSGNVRWTSRANLNDLHLLASDEYTTALFDKYMATGFTANGVFGGYDEIQELYLNYKNGNMTEADARAEAVRLGSFNNRSQLNELFYQKALTHQHNLTFRSGGENHSTYISLNYDYTRETEIGNNNHKFNLLVNNDLSLSSKLSLQLNVRGTLQSGHNNAVPVLYYEPWKRVLNEDGSLYDAYTNPYSSVSPVYRAKCEALGMKDWSYNPLHELRDNDNQVKGLNLATSARLAWKPVKGLELSSQFSYEYGRTETESLYSEDHFYTRDLVNRFTEVTLDESGYPLALGTFHLPTSGGIKDTALGRTHSYVFRNTASYQHTWGDIGMKLLAGNEIYSYDSNSTYSRLWGYKEDLLTVQSVDEASLQSGVKGYNGRTNVLYYTPNISEGLERYVSWFGTASVSFKDRYDLFTSLRLDQTNLLTNSSKYRNNPAWSLGGKWNITNEEFVNLPFLDYLSLRASYGLSGNIDKTTSPDMVVSSATGAAIKSLNILYVTNPANPQLGWEKTYSFNLGLDFSLWHNKLSGSLDFYQKRSEDLLALVQTLDPTTGWPSFYKNSASMVNRGIDLALRANLIQKQNLRWDVNLNFSYNYNKVNKLLYTPTASSMLGFGSSYVEGEPASVLMAVRYGGLDENGEPTFMKAGDDTRYGWNELSSIGVEDLKVMGRTAPPVFGSLSSSLKYNDFTFHVMLSYKLGHKMRLPGTTNGVLWTEWFGSDYRWTEDGDNADKWVPKMYTASVTAPSNYEACLRYSDRLVDRADVIRLRSVSVEYDITPFLRLLKLNGGNIRFSAENLCYWAANDYGLDPDQVAGATGTLGLAVKPSFIGSLNINF